MSIIAGSGSMKMPSRNSATLTNSRNTHCWCATLSTQAPICAGTCSTVISHARQPVAPITTITVALVWNDLSSSAGIARHDRSP